MFGGLVSRELVHRGIPVTIAGRDLQQAKALAGELGSLCQARAVDVTQPAGCRSALAGHRVAVHCAGPFQRCDETVLSACLAASCHYVDIADDRRYVARVCSLGSEFERRGLAAVFGCSSLPGLSGALALLAREQSASPVSLARVTLLIGNRNPKGAAAVQSLLFGLGKPIAAPQGLLIGFHDREIVSLPPPFGRHAIYNFDSPDYDLLPTALGPNAVEVKVGFELKLATSAIALLARMGSDYGGWWVALLARLGRWFGATGCPGGAVMAEIFFADGSVARSTLSGSIDGQRMAALPCVLVAARLNAGLIEKTGSSSAYEFLGARHLLAEMGGAGFDLRTECAKRVHTGALRIP